MRPHLASLALFALAACTPTAPEPAPLARTAATAPPAASSSAPAPAARPTTTASAAGPMPASCFDLYYGIGIPVDLERARACFEQHLLKDPSCKGQSLDLDRFYLAAMLLDGQGGPADPERGAGILSVCPSDAAVTGLLDEAKKPRHGSLDFCRDVGGTTITIGECHMVDAARAKASQRGVDADLDAKLDADGKKLAQRALTAYHAFVAKEAEAEADKYRGGSIQSNVWKSAENALEQKRTQAIAKLFDHALTPGADPKKAEADLDKAFRDAADGDAQHKKLFEAARKAWLAYRDAEVALYVHALGAKLGKAEVERDMKAALAQRYKAQLEEAIKP